MRSKEWQRQKTRQKIREKQTVLKRKEIPEAEKFLEDSNRLNKISVGDIIKKDKPKYDREQAKRVTFMEVNAFLAYQC